jgi:hypothetical protein
MPPKRKERNKTERKTAVTDKENENRKRWDNYVHERNTQND